VNLETLIRALVRSDADVHVTDVLDSLWLATRGRELSLHAASPAPAVQQEIRTLPVSPVDPPAPGAMADPETVPREETPPPRTESEETADQRTPVYAPTEAGSGTDTIKASPVSLPAGRALSGRLALGRALKPFRRRWPSRRESELDEPLTAERTATLGGQLHPVFRPVQERWYDVELVLEDDPAIGLWRDTLRDFSQTLRDTGAFRDVRTWRLRMPAGNRAAELESAAGAAMPARALPGHGTRQLIFFATHGSSSRWSDGSYASVLAPWRRGASIVLLHLFDPDRWRHCALGEPQALAHTGEPGAVTSTLTIDRFWWTFSDKAQTLAVPVVPLAAAELSEWALMQMARGRRAPAVLLDPRTSTPDEIAAARLPSSADFERAVALLRELSLDSFRLAVFLSAGVFTLPVARLVQEAKFGLHARQQHLADVLLSGLVFARTPPENHSNDPNDLYYEFDPLAREILLRSLREEDARLIAESLEKRVSEYIESVQGRTIRFRALVANSEGRYELPGWAQPFARLGLTLLGGDAREQNPQQLVEAFRISVPAHTFGYIAVLAASRFFEQGLEPADLDSEIWRTVRDARLVRQDAQGRWRLVPGVEAVLHQIGVETPMLGLRLLWIDDKPQNIHDDLQRFTKLGATVEIATDTEGGLARLDREAWNVVISDMARGANRSAGLEFLRALLRNPATWPPVIIYSRTLHPAEIADLMAAGAFGYTDQPAELEGLVLEAAGRASQLLDRVARRAATMEALEQAEVSFPNAWQAIEEAPAEVAAEILWKPVGASRVFDDHLNAVRAMTGAHVVQLLAVTGSELQVVASKLGEGTTSTYSIADWDGLIGRAVRQREVTWVSDVRLDPDYIAAERATRSELVLPLFSQTDPSTVIGAVNVEMPQPDALTEQERQRLQKFCAPLAVRIPKVQPEIFVLVSPHTEDFCERLIRELRIEGGIDRILAVTNWPDARVNFSDTILVVIDEKTASKAFDFRLLQDPRVWTGRLIVVALGAPNQLPQLYPHIQVPVIDFERDHAAATRRLISELGGAAREASPDEDDVARMPLLNSSERLVQATLALARQEGPPRLREALRSWPESTPEHIRVGTDRAPALLTVLESAPDGFDELQKRYWEWYPPFTDLFGGVRLRWPMLYFHSDFNLPGVRVNHLGTSLSVIEIGSPFSLIDVTLAADEVLTLQQVSLIRRWYLEMLESKGATAEQVASLKSILPLPRSATRFFSKHRSALQGEHTLVIYGQESVERALDPEAVAKAAGITGERVGTLSADARSTFTFTQGDRAHFDFATPQALAEKLTDKSIETVVCNLDFHSSRWQELPNDAFADISTVLALVTDKDAGWAQSLNAFADFEVLPATEIHMGPEEQ
jgi:CheY-like chemotaxis protein